MKRIEEITFRKVKFMKEKTFNDLGLDNGNDFLNSLGINLNIDFENKNQNEQEKEKNIEEIKKNI